MKLKKEVETEQYELEKLEKMNPIQRDAYEKIKNLKTKKSRRSDKEDNAGEQAVDLIRKMKDAVEADWESNKKGQPALKRLLMMEEVAS